MRLQGTVLRPAVEDKITWNHTADGQYSARSAYKLQFVGMTDDPAAKCTWSTKAPPKCRFFTWLLLQNRIWTAARLQIRGWPNDYFCSLCIRNLETADHLFMECNFSLQVWDRVATWIREPLMAPANWRTTHELRLWYLDLARGASPLRREGVRSVIMLASWEIWKERNNRVFNRKCNSCVQVFRAIQEEAKVWIRAGNKGLAELLQMATSVSSLGVPGAP